MDCKSDTVSHYCFNLCVSTMVYEIRASADMIRANCLYSAVGWKEWGKKKDRKRLFPTTPPASSLKRGFARIISAFARLFINHGITKQPIYRSTCICHFYAINMQLWGLNWVFYESIVLYTFLLLFSSQSKRNWGCDRKELFYDTKKYVLQFSAHIKKIHIHSAFMA